MRCKERDRLAKQHDDAGTRFDAARNALNESIGIGTRAEWWRLNEEMDNAWVALRRTRALLDSHIREHCC
jgi:FAD/FMN-containing dehydrogenase